MKKILFVCLGNICRSPGAEGVMKAIVEKHHNNDIYVDSAGTGEYHIGELPDRRMRKAAAKRSINLTHRCRVVKPKDFDEFDLIIGMDSMNIVNLQRMAPTAAGREKIAPIGRWLSPSTGYSYVPDPYYEDDSAFELTLDLLENACTNLYNELTQDN